MLWLAGGERGSGGRWRRKTIYLVSPSLPPKVGAESNCCFPPPLPLHTNRKGIEGGREGETLDCRNFRGGERERRGCAEGKYNRGEGALYAGCSGEGKGGDIWGGYKRGIWAHSVCAGKKGTLIRSNSGRKMGDRKKEEEGEDMGAGGKTYMWEEGEISF